jgi:hypothetical protein
VRKPKSRDGSSSPIRPVSGIEGVVVGPSLLRLEGRGSGVPLIGVRFGWLIGVSTGTATDQRLRL